MSISYSNNVLKEPNLHVGVTNQIPYDRISPQKTKGKVAYDNEW